MNQKEMPLVSVVIPTYSRNDTLCTAIDSVLAQSYQNFEIIIVDDNPADSEWRKSTEELVAKYADNPRVRYLKNKVNLGGAGARNEGIKAAKGEYIAFLDDDDMYFEKKIEKQIDCFLNSSNEKLALVLCDAEMTFDDEVFICNTYHHYSGNCLYEAMRDNCLAPTSQWMAKKSALLDVGMFTIVPCKQDSTLILKLLVNGYEVDHVPEVLSRFCSYQNQGRISNSGMKNINGELAYRTRCRQQYHRLSKDQIREVEYAFAHRLYELYKKNNMKDESNKYMNFMLRVHLLKTIKVEVRTKLSELKWKVKGKGDYFL